LFNRKPRKEIVPYPNNKNKNTAAPPTASTDTLNKMRDTQVISNYEYMQLSLQLEMLNKLNSIDVSCKSIAVSNEFLGKYVLNKFKWF
jgi:hypothetical protein